MELVRGKVRCLCTLSRQSRQVLYRCACIARPDRVPRCRIAWWPRAIFWILHARC